MGRPDPFLARFHAFRGPLPVFSPPRTAFGFPTPDLRLRTSAHPSRPVASRFQPRKRLPRSFSVEKFLARAPIYKIGMAWRLARIYGLSARTLFPDRAARCAIDPPPHFRYSLATQEKSPRHVKPT